MTAAVKVARVHLELAARDPQRLTGVGLTPAENARRSWV